MSKSNRKSRKDYIPIVDLLVFWDKDYLIYKKNGRTTGSLLVPLDLIRIALSGLFQCLIMFDSKNERLQIIDTIVDKLLEIRNNINILEDKPENGQQNQNTNTGEGQEQTQPS